MNKKMTLSLLSLSLLAFSQSALSANAQDYLAREVSSWTHGTDYKNNYSTLNHSQAIPGNKISSITVYDDGWYIKGMKITYEKGGSGSFGKTSGDKRVISLAEDEYITSGSFWKSSAKTSSRSMKRITAMKFYTNTGNSYGFGQYGSKSKKYNWTVEDGRGVLGFHGTYNDNKINSIGIITDRILDLEIQDISFDYNNVNLNGPIQSYSGTFLLDANELPLAQNTPVILKYTRTESSSDSFINTAGITEEMNIGIDIEAKAAKFADVTANFGYHHNITTVHESVVAGSNFEQYTTSLQIDATLTNPARFVAGIKTQVYVRSAEFPYTITYKNKADDVVFDVQGTIEHQYELSAFTRRIHAGVVDDNGTCIIYDRYANNDDIQAYIGSECVLESDYIAQNGALPVVSDTASIVVTEK
ncbi:jacalin-like lectin [uncultured Shewanella sp.]|uniref:jacalin-like lectin n=1 Tax=uncultured Shewanella sp. TaxID=173975 RepID=UPI0026146970|nr:jacalin-like lectin [uncultured Shewanella sp.]